MSTVKTIDFYFDFISPFGYLASREIDAFAERHGWDCDWHPMLLGVSVLKVMGMKPLRDVPLKGPYLLRELARHCRRAKVDLSYRLAQTAPTNPLEAGRAFVWAKTRNPTRAKRFAQGLLQAHWREEQDIERHEVIAACYERATGESAKALIEALDSGEAGPPFRAAVDESIARGVFGSPFFLIDGEPFFGFDKLGIMDEWIASGGW